MSDTVKLLIDGAEIAVPVGTTVAVALANAGRLAMHRSVLGELRGPVCGMGICFECRVWVNGRPDTRSCMVACADGMEVITHHA